VIADHRAEAGVSHEEIEHFAVLWTFRDQIPDRHDAIVRGKTDLLEQFHQLVVATVNVSYYNRSTQSNPPLAQGYL
jgi:hypothetical protein